MSTCTSSGGGPGTRSSSMCAGAAVSGPGGLMASTIPSGGGVSPQAPWPLSCRPHLSIFWGIPIPKCAGHYQHQRLVLEEHHVILIHAQDLWVRRTDVLGTGVLLTLSPPSSHPLQGWTQAPTCSLTPRGSPGSSRALTSDPLLSSRVHLRMRMYPTPTPDPCRSALSPTRGSKAFRKSLPSCCA